MKKNYRKINLITNLILVLIFSAVVAVSFVPESVVTIYGGSQINAIYNGDRTKKNVSLMFNVYENSENVIKIVDILNKYNAKATFFVGGCWADDNQKTLDYIVNNNHELANHGYFHKDHAKLSYEKNKEEISLCGKIVNALSGVSMNLFAPPSGSFSEKTLEAASDLGYKVIMWSKDTIDWRDSNKDLIVKRATKNIFNGDLILFHPKTHTLLALPEILEYYISVGLNMVTVSENIA